MKTKSLFQIIQGHQITDEEIYIKEGNIPVITGRNQIKGYWNNKIIEEEDLPCITYPTKANVGNAYIQTKIFDANNTAVLIPLPNWRAKIDLEWMSFKLRTTFLKIQTSKGGVSYLNKDIVEELEFDIPPKNIQEEEKRVILELLTIKNKIDGIIKKIQEIKSSPITIEYSKYQGKQISAKELFNSISGNSGLTEEYLYSVMLNGEQEEKYKVLTGSMDIKSVQETHLCPHPKNPTKKITVFSGEGIHIVRNGEAGHINYIPYGNYTLNDHAYILVQNKNNHYKLSLKWLAYTHQHLFLEYSSNVDNGTWNKTGFFEHAVFDIPSMKEQKKILRKLEILNEYEYRLNLIYNKTVSLLNKGIVEMTMF